MKRNLMVAFILLCLAVCVFGVVKMSNKDDHSFVTALSIYDITEKKQDDEFYLTVALDDFVVEEYSLSQNDFTFQVKESIYNKVIANSGFTGVSLKVTIPYDQPKSDIGMILKENRTDYCEIISVTTKDNILID